MKLIPIFFFSLIIFGASDVTVYAEEEYIIQQMFKIGKKNVYDTIFSSDNQLIVTLSGTHKLEVRDSSLGTPIKTFSTGKHKAISMIAHPHEPVLITGGKDHSIHFWDMVRGVTQTVLHGHISGVKSLSIHSEGHLLASGGEGGTILIWDVRNMVLQSTIRRAHQGTINTIDIHPNGKLIASGGRDRKIRIWNLETGQLITELSEHAGEVTTLAFHPNGRLLASGSQDKTIKLWNWQERFVEYTLSGHDSIVNSLSFHPDGELLISGSEDRTIRLWNPFDGKMIGSLKSVEEQVVAVHFNPNGKQIVAAMEMGISQVWKINTSSFFGELKGHKRLISSLDFTKNNKYLLSTALDKTIKVWNVQNQKLISTYPTKGHRVLELRISPDSKTFATAGADSQIGLWKTQSGKREASLVLHKGKVNSVDFHPTESVLLSGGADKQWILWDLKSRNVIKTKVAHTDQVTVVRFSPDGTHFATGSADQSVQVWSYPEGHLLFNLKGHRKTIRGLAFSPVHPLLASASEGETIKIWDIERGQGLLQNDLKGHSFQVTGISFSADGSVLISASRDKTTRLWDVETGSLIRILSGEYAAISSMSLRPDGKLIALGTLAHGIVLLEYPFDLENVQQSMKRSNRKASASKSRSLSSNIALNENVIDETDLEGVEGEQQPNTQIYKLTQVENFSEAISKEQISLNAILLQGNVCENINKLERSALKILERAPEDLSAYHALLKVAIAKQDINMIFLISKIGNWATFVTNRYNYAQDIDIKNNFAFWNNQVFDQSEIKDGNTLNLSVESCKGNTEEIHIPEALYYLDIPHEYLKSVITIPRLVDLRDFKSIDTTEFKNRLLLQIQEKLKSPKANIENRPSLDPAFQSSGVLTGRLVLNFEKSQRWGYPTRVKFQLRERADPWQSYFTANDKRKVLMLPIGQYYLKFRGKIRRAFELKTDKEVMIEGIDIQ